MKLTTRLSAVFGPIVHDGIAFTPKSWLDMERESPIRRLLDMFLKMGVVEIIKIDPPKMYSEYPSNDGLDHILFEMTGDSLIRFECNGNPIPDNMLPPLVSWASLDHGKTLVMYPEEGVLLRVNAEQGDSEGTPLRGASDL